MTIMSLQTKTALVTGSGSGLGLSIANHLLSLGANVIICDINPQRLSEARPALEASHPNRTLILEADVADQASVQALIAASIARFGALDMVVNNAGVMDRFDPAVDCDLDMWHRVLAVNLTGPFLVTKHAVPHMLARAKEAPGLIVNIGSVASFRGLAGGVAYTASKHGVMALTKHTAGFYGRQGVHSVALLLGGMDTNIADAFSGGLNMEGLSLMQETMPGSRTVPTEHVARYVAFLSEDGMGKSANGSCIVLNGNWPEA